jgi:hypothetical protein
MNNHTLIKKLLALACLAAGICICYCETIRMSNELLELEVNLAAGGRVTALRDKRRGQDWTRFTDSPGGSGLFTDALSEPVSRKADTRYRTASYSVVSRQDGQEKRLALRSPAGLPLDILKTYCLPADSDTLTVEYELTNPGTKDVVTSFWGGNALTNPGESSYRLDFPTARFSHGWTPQTPMQKNCRHYQTGTGTSADCFFFQPDRGYAAVTAKAGTAVLEMPFALLDFLYTWESPSADGLAIIDWFSLPFQLPPLAQGQAEVALHAVLEDPLANYKYRFQVSLKLLGQAPFDYEQYGGPSTEKKSTALAPQLQEEPLHSDFALPAAWTIQSADRLRAVVIAQALGTAELMEMNRRLGLDLQLVETASLRSFKATPYMGWHLPFPERQLEQALDSQPELIIVCGQKEESLPAELVARLRASVEAGAGFLFLGERFDFPSLLPQDGWKDTPPEIYAGTMSGLLPSFGKVHESQQGQGQVFWVEFPFSVRGSVRDARAVIPHVPVPPEGFPYWEGYFAFYGKLFRHAAKRTPEVRMLNVSLEADQARLHLQSELPQQKAELVLTEIAPSGVSSETLLWRGALPAGSKEFALPWPSRPWKLTGDYYCLFSVRTAEGGTLDWYAVRDRRQGTVVITDILPGKRLWDTGEDVTGQVILQGTGELQVRLLESATGRVAARQVWPAAQGTVSFALRREILSADKLYDLEVQVRDSNGALLAAGSKSLLIAPEVHNREWVQPLVWGAHLASWREKEFLRELSGIGFRLYKAPWSNNKTDSEFVSETEAVLRSGMDCLPLGIIHIRSEKGLPESPTVRRPCLRQPDYRQQVLKKAQQMGERLRNNLLAACFVGDELTMGSYFNSRHDFCTSSWCLADFRQTMENKYGSDLGKLNDTWGTAFNSWEAVVPDSMVQASQRGNYASWFEHRLYMLDSMRLLLSEMAGEVKRLSGAETGVSGMEMTQLYQGFDLLGSLDFMKTSAFYITPFTADAIRSRLTPEHLVGAYTDYGMRYSVWEQLISGLRMPSVWWYAHAQRRGDARPSPEGLRLKEIFGNIRSSGADYVLGTGQRAKSGIAQVWSNASLVAAEIGGQTGGLQAKDYTGNLNSWSELLRELGLDAPAVLTTEELARISPGEFPVLILPLLQVLSSAEIIQLERYVKEGGRLIADLFPGRYNEFGAPQVNPRLLALFGLKSASGPELGRSGSLQLESSDELPELYLGGPLELAEGAQARGALGLRSRAVKLGGISLAESFRKTAPAAVSFRQGAGETLYLNFALPDYYQRDCRLERRSRALTSALAPFLAPSGLRQSVPPAANLARYWCGGGSYIFLSRGTSDSRGEYTLRWEKSGHIYEQLTHTYVGEADSVQGLLEEHGVRMYALFPEKLSPLEGSISFDGRYFRLEAHRAGGGSCQSVVRLTVSRNGEEVPQLCSTGLLSEAGKWSVDLGLEPQPGAWQLHLLSTADGSVLERTVTIPEPGRPGGGL